MKPRDIKCVFSTEMRCDLPIKTVSHDYWKETKSTNQNVAEFINYTQLPDTRKHLYFGFQIIVYCLKMAWR